MNKELFFSTVIFLIIALIMAVSFKSSDIVVEDTVISEDNPPVQDVVYDADIDPEESSVSDDIKSEEEDKRKGYLALIIDDVGYGREDKFKIFERLYGHKITFSIIPGTFNAKKAEEDAINSGFEVMAHLPMQAEGVDNPYEKEIRTDMTHEVLYKRIEELLSEFKHIKGANNHMGSKATADKRTMLTLMTYLKKRNMFFVDSLTTPNSVIKEVAEVLDVDYLASAKLDDLLTIRSEIMVLKRASLIFKQQIVNQNNQLIVSAVITVAAVNIMQGKPCAIPKTILGALKRVS